MGGYECADHQNCFGLRVDLATDSGHLDLLDEDYERLHAFHIRTVREGIRWSFVEKRPYEYDWSMVRTMIESGRRQGIQQIWDLCHFGYPDDLSPLHPMFARRLAALSRAFVHFYRSLVPDGPLIITPVNEVSFISWLGGEARGTVPYCVNQGWEVKYHLMRAYIESVAAMREIDPTVLILSTEPLVNMVPTLDADEEEQEAARAAHEDQYQAMDILTGRMCPELGGRPEYLNILGLNYYYNNQWVVGKGTFLPWVNEPFDPRWRPLRSLLKEAHSRYGCPFILSETSHPGEHRPNWTELLAKECAAVLLAGYPLWGVCLYPIIDRPDWDFPDNWHRAGLWDAEHAEGQLPRRVLFEPYAQALREAQALVLAVSGQPVALGTAVTRR